MTCKAIREGDEMACSCGLRWGVDDDDRPQCLTDDEIVEVVPELPEFDHTVGTEAIKEMRESITPEKKERLHHGDK